MPHTEWKVKDRMEASRMRYQLRRFKKKIAEDGDNARSVALAVDALMLELDGMVDFDDDGAVMPEPVKTPSNKTAKAIDQARELRGRFSSMESLLENLDESSG